MNSNSGNILFFNSFLHSVTGNRRVLVLLFAMLTLEGMAASPDLSGINCTPPSTSQISSTGLLTHYVFDGNTNDVSGNVNTGLPLNGASLTSDRFSVANSAYLFNGSNQWMATTNGYVNPNTFTIGLWFKTTSTSGGGLMGFCDNQTSTGTINRDRVIYMNNAGQLRFGVYTGSVQSINPTESYNDGYWHFVMASLSPSGMKIYVDGLLKAVNTSITAGQNMTGYWRVGYFDLSNGWSTATSHYFNGTLDEIYYYSRELSLSEIQTLYEMPYGAGSDSPKCSGETLSLKGATISGATYSWTGPNGFTSTSQNPQVTNMSAVKEGLYYLTITDASSCSTAPIPVLVRMPTVSVPISQVPTTGLITRYTFKGNSNDVSGNSNTGILQNSPPLISDRFGIANAAYSFNGSNQYISTTVSYNNPSVFTIGLWFKTTTSTGGKLIGFGNSQTGTSSTYDRQIYMTNEGQLVFGVNSGSPKTIATTDVYNDGQWHFVTATLSGAGMKIYVDGSLQSSDPSVTAAQNYIGYWKVGYDEIQNTWPSSPSSKYFMGALDDVYLYNTELSGAQIITLYNNPGGAGSNEPFCGTGGTLNLTAPALGAAYSYVWTGPNGFVSLSQSPSISGITAANAGVYTLTVTTTSSCPAKAYVNVRIQNTPAAPAATGASRCGPGTVVLNASGSPLKYRWYAASSGGTSLAGTSSYTTPGLSNDATYYVSSVNSAGCESATRTAVTAIISPLPSAPTAPAVSRCGPGTVTLTASGSPSDYKWYAVSSGGASIGTGSSITTSVTSDSIFYVSSVTVAGCESIARNAVIVTVNPLPSAPVVPGVSRCGPGTVTLTASGSPSDYKWYAVSSGGVSIGTGASITPSVSSDSIFYVSSVSAAGCESITRTSVTVTINPVPSVPTAPSVFRCGPGIVTLTAGGSPSDYKWYAASSGGASIGTGSSITPSVNSDSNFYVSSVSAAGCESVTRTTVMVSVSSLPSAPIGKDTSICGPGMVALTATGSPSDYKWYAASSGGTVLGTGSSFTPSVNSDTVFYVSSVTSEDCESATRTTVTVSINPVPSAPAASGVSRCGPGTVTLTASGSSSGYKWYAVSSGGASIGTGASITPSVSSDSIFYVSSVSTSGCESTTRASVTATVNLLPSAPTATGASRCGPGTVNLTASSSPLDYKWYANLSGGASIGTGSGFIPFVNSDSIFYVSSVSAAGCESSTRTAVTATINPVPSSPATTGDNVCVSGIANLTASGSPGGYRWYAAASGGSVLNTTAVYSPFVNANTDFYVSSEDNGCESSRVIVSALVSPLNDAGTLNGSQIVCSGSNTGIVQLTGYTGAIQKWEESFDAFASDVNDLGNTSDQYPYNDLIETRYYRVIVKSGVCPADTSAVIEVTVNPPTDPGVLSGNGVITSPVNSGSISLMDYTGTILRWESSTDDFATFSIINNNTPDYTYTNLSATTKYRVRVKSGVCPEGLSNIVTIVLPVALIADTIRTTMNVVYHPGITVLANDYIDPSYSLQPMVSAVTNKGGTITMDTLGYFTYTPPEDYTGLDQIIYSVCDKATGTNCFTAPLIFIVRDTVIVYSSLTPNGDNLNDTWIIDGIGSFPDNNVKILNRWGDVVYQQKSYNNQDKVWKGECNSGILVGGSRLPDGTYFYSIELGDGSGSITGYVVVKQ